MKGFTFFGAFLAAAIMLLGGCRNDTPQMGDPLATYDVFGDTLMAENALPAQAVVADVDGFLGRTVKMEGTVREVCQMAGCWLTVDAGEGRYVRVRVPRTEDGSYVFTVPKDIDGRRVVVEGTLAEGLLSVEEQAHMAEESGEPVDTTALAPMTEYQLTARGVLVERTEVG